MNPKNVQADNTEKNERYSHVFCLFVFIIIINAICLLKDGGSILNPVQVSNREDTDLCIKCIAVIQPSGEELADYSLKVLPRNNWFCFSYLPQLKNKLELISVLIWLSSLRVASTLAPWLSLLAQECR